MTAAIVYIDISEVREGALDELKAGLKDIVDFIEAKEPRLLAYNVYFSADGTTMTVMNVHPDAASLEYHMEWRGRSFVGSWGLSRCHRSTSTASRARRRWSWRMRRRDCWEAAPWRSRPYT